MKEFRITTVVTGTIEAETLEEAVDRASDMTVFDILDANSEVGALVVDDPNDPNSVAVTI